MKKHFHSHITETHTIHVELEGMNMSEEEKKHIIELIERAMHHKVLDTVLSELQPEDKKTLLQQVLEDDHEKIWNFIHEKTENIEDKIKEAASDLKQKLLEDIRSSKTTSN